MNKTFSLHKIADANNFGFDANDYSKFKYGADEVAEKFGKALAFAFIKNELSKIVIDKQIVVISSPYAFIPTATFALKNYFIFELNKWLAHHNYPIAQETKIFRTITYKEDYGALDAAERMKLIGNDHFHIDASFLNNKLLIFIDDIKITGSHERMITKMMTEFNLNNDAYFLYFAELVNTTIHPNIENLLNFHAIKVIFDLDILIKSNRFVINTRIVKFILNTEEDLFKAFINNKPNSFINLLYNMAIGNNYHTIKAYQPSMNILKQIIGLNK